MGRSITLEEYTQTGTPQTGKGVASTTYSTLFRDEETTFDANGFLEIPESQRAKWRRKGEIGVIEQARRTDLGDMITLGAKGTFKAWGVFNAVNRLQKDEYLPGSDQKATDQETFKKYMMKLAEEQERGVSIGGGILRGVSELPAFIIPFIISGGTASFVQQGTRAAVKKLIGKKIAKTLAGRAVAGTAGLTAAGAARLPFQPIGIAERTFERQIQSSYQLTEKGIQVMDEATEKPFTSFGKAIGDMVIENISEQAGEVFIGPALNRVSEIVFPRRMGIALSQVFKKMHPNESISRLATRAGYNGFITELGEERFGDILRAVTNVNSYGETDDGIMDRIIDSIPSGEELLIEAGVIGSLGGVNVAAQQIASNRAKKKRSKIPKTKIAEEDRIVLTEEEVNQIAEGKPAPKRVGGEVVRPEDVIEEGVIPGIEVATEARELGSDQGGISDFLFDKIKSENFKIEEVSIEELRQKDKDLDDFIKSGEIREFEGEPFAANPIVSSSGEVLDGFNRIAQAVADGEATISILKGQPTVAKPVDVTSRRRKKPADLTTVGKFVDTQLQAEIDKAEEKKDELELTEIELQRNLDIAKEIPKIKRTDKKGNVIEELAEIPRQFIDNKKGRPIDEVLQEVNSDLGLPSFESTSDLAVELKALVPKIKSLREEISELKPGFVRKRETTVLKDKIRNIQRGFRKGKVLGRQETLAVQKNIEAILNASQLSAKDKQKFQKTIRNTQTVEQLKKLLSNLDARISALQEKADVRDLKARIQKRLKRTKVKKVAGKPRGKFGADIQAIVDKARAISKLSQADAQAQIDANLEKFSETIPPPEIALQNRLLSLFGGLNNKSAEELAETLDELDALTATGRAISALEKMATREKREKAREVAHDVILGDKPPDPTRLNKFTESLRKWASRFGSSLDGWNGLMDILSQDDLTSTQDQSKLSVAMRVFDIEQNEKDATRLDAATLVQMAIKSFNVTNEKEVLNRLTLDEEVEGLGWFENAKGEQFFLKLSKAQARKRWMEFQDPSLRKTLTSPEGNAYTEEMVQALNNFLSAEDVAFAKAQLQFYKDFYKKINKVYRRIYGVDLPFNEFYSPISRIVDKNNIVTEFMQEILHRRSIAPQGLKTRVENINELDNRSDVAMLQKHIIEMNHFMHWADKLQEINNIFGSKKIERLIDDKYGHQMNRLIQGFVEDFTRGGVDRSATYLKWLDALRRNFTISVLAIKPNIGIKQLTSFIAAAEDIPTEEFIKGVAEWAIKPQEILKTLEDSKFLKNRGNTPTRDLKEALSSKDFQLFAKSHEFQDLLVVINRMGDKGGILLGGWSIYRYNKEVLGKSHEESLSEFDRISQQTQQSPDLSQLSVYQRGGAFAKLFTMFTSAPNQYLRRINSATRNVLKKRITKRQFIKKIFIYNTALPVLFSWVAMAGRWDEEELVYAGLTGGLTGVFFVGDMANAVLRSTVNIIFDTELDVFDPRIALFDVVTDISRAPNEFDDIIDVEDLIEAIKDLSEDVIGPVTALPVKQVFNGIEGAINLFDEDFAEGTLKLLGWSPSIIDRRLEE